MRKTLPLRLYGRALGLAGPLAAGGVLHWRLRKGREIGSRLPERRGIATRPRPEGPLVWIHAASVGRFTAVLPLVEAIIGRGFNVLVTTTTLNAAQLAARRLRRSTSSCRSTCRAICAASSTIGARPC